MFLLLGTGSFCEGDSVELTSTFVNGNQWYKDGTALNGATQQTYYAKQNGYYHLRVTQQNGGPDLYSDSTMVNVITSNGGMVNKFGGDSLLAVFGTTTGAAFLEFSRQDL